MHFWERSFCHKHFFCHFMPYCFWKSMFTVDKMTYFKLFVHQRFRLLTRKLQIISSLFSLLLQEELKLFSGKQLGMWNVYIYAIKTHLYFITQHWIFKNYRSTIAPSVVHCLLKYVLFWLRNQNRCNFMH